MKKLIFLLPILAMVFAQCAQKPQFSETVLDSQTKSFTCQEFTATNSAHKTAGRATTSYVYYYYAVGSGTYLGLSSSSTTLAETSPGYFIKGNCPAADTQAPTITITAPTSGSTVSGNVTLSSTSSDNVGVTRVLYTTLGVGMTLCETTTAPFTCTWDSSAFTSSTNMSVVAVAYDAAGNEGTSESVLITVENGIDTIAPAISITSPSNNALIGSSFTLTTAATDNIGVTKVEFYVRDFYAGESTTAPFSMTFDTTQWSDSSHKLTAVAYDAAGNTTTSEAVYIVVDNSAPLVAITSPANSSTVSSGTPVTFSVDASDNNGVTRVKYTTLGNGMLLCETTTAPFSCTWDSSVITSTTNMTVVATAYDAAGNETSSTGILLTIESSFTCQQWTTTAGSHSLAGRASYKTGTSGYGYYTVGGNDFIGQYLTSATVKETAAGFYQAGTCN